MKKKISLKQMEAMELIGRNGETEWNRLISVFSSETYCKQIIKRLVALGFVKINFGNVSLTTEGEEYLLLGYSGDEENEEIYILVENLCKRMDELELKIKRLEDERSR